MRIISSIFILLFTLISGCASNIPVEISTPVVDSPTVPQALVYPKFTEQKAVRWGGSIARVENKPSETLIEIVSKRLDRNGRPVSDDKTDGRFIAIVDGFLDPLIYSEGRLVTVHGQLSGLQAGKIDQREYQFPLVNSSTVYLWEEYMEVQQPVYPPGYWPYYDPFWDPYWHRRGFWGPRWW